MYFPALAIREAKVEINCVKFLLKVEVSAKSLKYLKKMLFAQLGSLCVRLFVTIAHQALLSMEFSKQDYWGG